MIPTFNYNNFSSSNHSYSNSHSHPEKLSILTNSVAAPAAATLSATTPRTLEETPAAANTTIMAAAVSST
jgi:hypothetical protein